MFLKKEIQLLKEKEMIRKQKIKEIKEMSLSEYLCSQEKINDDYLYYSSFEFFIEKNHRSKTGSFYTPEWIVMLMCQDVIKKWYKNNDKDALWNIKILDPACGTGNYPHGIIKVLLEIFKNEYQEKNDNELLKYIINNCLYAYDINETAIIKCKERIKNLFGVEAKNVIVKNTLCEKSNELFDIIIGNPPYGNLLNKEDKKELNDKYSNIALSFINWALNNIKQSGEIAMIVPHSFTRVATYKEWREELYKQKCLYKIIDVGNPFYDITLEEVIFFFNKKKNDKIKSFSIKDLNYCQNIGIEDFYNKKFNYQMIIYWDEIYKKINENADMYPFSGKRGCDILKGELLQENDTDCLWFILGKNIQKGYLKKIKGYDRYIKKDTIKDQYNRKKYLIEKEKIAITQFGIKLKAAIIDNGCYPSGGIVIIDYKELTEKEVLGYLNDNDVNEYLKKYIFNMAELTVHIDGVYLEQLPYIELEKLKEILKEGRK